MTRLSTSISPIHYAQRRESARILSKFTVNNFPFLRPSAVDAFMNPILLFALGVAGTINWNGRMGRLEIAEGRLDRALARLEAAAARPRIDITPSELERELAASQARCNTLESTTQEVSTRLDATIARIYAILEGDHGAG